MKSTLKYTPLMLLIQSEFGSAMKAADLLGIAYPTLYRWLTQRPERLLELTLHGGTEFNAQLLEQINRLIQIEGRERGGQC
jgi:hypothetical protein